MRALSLNEMELVSGGLTGSSSDRPTHWLKPTMQQMMQRSVSEMRYAIGFITSSLGGEGGDAKAGDEGDREKTESQREEDRQRIEEFEEYMDKMPYKNPQSAGDLAANWAFLFEFETLVRMGEAAIRANQGGLEGAYGLGKIGEPMSITPK